MGKYCFFNVFYQKYTQHGQAEGHILYAPPSQEKCGGVEHHDSDGKMFDKVLKMVYTLRKGGVCVEEVKNNDSNVGIKSDCNEEFGFLYKKCRKVKPYVITAISHVPQFMEAIRQADKSGITWSDVQLYEVLKMKYLRMISYGKSFPIATNIMNKVSKAVTGSPSTWRE